MKIKFIKNCVSRVTGRKYKKGQIIWTDDNTAERLIKKGNAKEETK